MPSLCVFDRYDIKVVQEPFKKQKAADPSQSIPNNRVAAALDRLVDLRDKIVEGNDGTCNVQRRIQNIGKECSKVKELRRARFLDSPLLTNLVLGVVTLFAELSVL